MRRSGSLNTRVKRHAGLQMALGGFVAENGNQLVENKEGFFPGLERKMQ